MRVAQTDTIAGLPAPAATSPVRLFRGGMFTKKVADSLLSKYGVEDSDAAFGRMEEAGYLVRAEIDGDTYVWWEATTLGSALAMASFGKPIRRRTADGLVSGMLGRAREYKKPLYIERLRVFGSYFRPADRPARRCRRRAVLRHAHQGSQHNQRLNPGQRQNIQLVHG